MIGPDAESCATTRLTSSCRLHSAKAQPEQRRMPFKGLRSERQPVGRVQSADNRHFPEERFVRKSAPRMDGSVWIRAELE
jgi:hypothetical protein